MPVHAHVVYGPCPSRMAVITSECVNELAVVAGCELTGQRVHHPVGVHVEPGRTKQCTATLFRGD